MSHSKTPEFHLHSTPQLCWCSGRPAHRQLEVRLSGCKVLFAPLHSQDTGQPSASAPAGAACLRLTPCRHRPGAGVCVRESLSMFALRPMFALWGCGGCCCADDVTIRADSEPLLCGRGYMSGCGGRSTGPSGSGTSPPAPAHAPTPSKQPVRSQSAPGEWTTVRAWGGFASKMRHSILVQPSSSNLIPVLLTLLAQATPCAAPAAAAAPCACAWTAACMRLQRASWSRFTNPRLSRYCGIFPRHPSAEVAE